MLFAASRITPWQARILATRLERRARALRDGTQTADELREVEAALTRVNGGSYGLCTDCNAPLPLVRLGALPHERLCAQCAAAHEGAPPATA